MTTSEALNKVASEEGYTDFIVLMANSNIGFITDRVKKAMIIYAKSVLAEIMEDVPEYVECVSEYPPIGATKGKIYKAFYQPNSLNPYRWYTDGAASGENGYSTLQMFNQIFKSSTKEAYDAQFKTKELTITLDGDVVNTSHWGNNVKITYK